MNAEQTRQLGIEFERRVQTMIPETEFIAKLDTETIYSYLNQYQDKLIHDLYRTIDQIPQSNNETYIETLLNSLTESVILQLDANPYEPDVFVVDLPDDFGLYIKSHTKVYSSYSYKVVDNRAVLTAGVLPNTLISLKDVNLIINRPQDNMRILRNPVVWLAANSNNHKILLGAIYDRHTEAKEIHLDYYRVPNYMNPLESIDCELPMEMFELLVSGAVDLYVQYVAGAEARKRLMLEQQREQLKRDEQ